jgi:hypothetical protein
VNYSHLDSCGTLTRDAIAARRALGVPDAQIAREAGVAESTLYLALHDWHLTTKRGGDRRSPSWRARFGMQLGGAA